MTFEWDEKALDKAVREAARGGIKDITRDMQDAVDDVHRTHAGKPEPEVRRALQRKRLTADVVNLCAPLISKGDRVQFRSEI